jgi:hypothetical protein
MFEDTIIADAEFASITKDNIKDILFNQVDRIKKVEFAGDSANVRVLHEGEWKWLRVITAATAHKYMVAQAR